MARLSPPDVWQSIGWSGKAFVILLLVTAIVRTLSLGQGYLDVSIVLLALVGAVVVWKLLRVGVKQLVWRVRNRLAVAYIFMALVPVVLLLTMALIVTYIMAGQTAAYMVTSEFERRVVQLRSSLEAVTRSPVAIRGTALSRLAGFYEQNHEGFVLHYESPEGELRFPEGSPVKPPPRAWGEASGIVARDGGYYVWARILRDGAAITGSYPLTTEELAGLARGLGGISLVTFLEVGNPGELKGVQLRFGNTKKSGTDLIPQGEVPAAVNSFDMQVGYWAPTRYGNWEEPGSSKGVAFLIRSRVSAVFRALFRQDVEVGNEIAEVLLRIVGGLFIVVEIIALIIGVSLTRSLTRAVHNLYEGTERVMEGDFSHRIQEKGQDQIAALSRSFNRMTENLEQLLQVAKEKERLQADLEIAREVQNQLYPASVPRSVTLSIAAMCHPARMVSGDFYDYQTVAAGKIALLVGDVAGKGISAALLMATIQSTFRAQVRALLEVGAPCSTSNMVTQLNHQLYLNTAPEKYATLVLGVYDDSTSVLTYTNGAHLPPILWRRGEIQRLSVDGTVVGAFPQVPFGESQIQLESGDLLVFFTDGVSEPENEYGEQFGEDRLIDLIGKNAHRGEKEIIQVIVDAVTKWTGSAEPQDDITMVVARRR